MSYRKTFKALAIAASSLFAAPAMGAPVLWNADSDGTLGTVDVADGTVSVIGQMSTVMTDIAFDGSGNLYGISFTDLYSIDKTNASTVLIGSHSLSTGTKNSLVFSGSTLYAANTSLYTLNTTTGASSLVGSAGNGYSSSGDLAIAGGALRLSSTSGSGAGSGDSLWSINTSTGQGTDIGKTGVSGMYGLASPEGTTLYGAAGLSVYTLNLGTGAATSAQTWSSATGLGNAFGTAFFAEATNPIPLPAPFLLLLGGLGGLGFVSRKRKAA
jgi:hypothetical protein